MACGSCGGGAVNGQRRQRITKIQIEVWETHLSDGTVLEFASEAEATAAAASGGQVRLTQKSVPAVYRLWHPDRGFFGDEYSDPVAAAVASRGHKGSKVKLTAKQPIPA